MSTKKRGEKHNFKYSELSEKEKELIKQASQQLNPNKKILTFNDLLIFEDIKNSLFPLQKKYGLNLTDLFSLIPSQLSIPLSIFNKELTVLQTVVKYLKETKKFSFHEIANIINRDERNIWHIYNETKIKYSEKFKIKQTKLSIPVQIFSNPKLSALETLVVFLKDQHNFSFRQIGHLLKRNERTIWTVYQRANKK